MEVPGQRQLVALAVIVGRGLDLRQVLAWKPSTGVVRAAVRVPLFQISWKPKARPGRPGAHSLRCRTDRRWCPVMLPACFSPSRKVRLASPFTKVTSPPSAGGQPQLGADGHRHLGPAVPVHIGRSGQLQARPSKVTVTEPFAWTVRHSDSTMASVSAKDKIRFVVALTLDALLLFHFSGAPSAPLSTFSAEPPPLSYFSKRSAMYHLSYSDEQSVNPHFFGTSSILFRRGATPFPSPLSSKRRARRMPRPPGRFCSLV